MTSTTKRKVQQRSGLNNLLSAPRLVIHEISHPMLYCAANKMLQVHCSGSPREIGLQHGKAAHLQILRGLQFYKEYYREEADLEWDEAIAAALKFLPLLDSKWPDFVIEMRAIAEGAGVSFEDVLTMNIRSEISMGMMTTKDIDIDGCTSLSYHSTNAALLAQNWDWDVRQQSNIIALHISPRPGRGPRIAMITEAGLLGKIGLNANGVGVCLNAIRIPGVSFSALPLHLALRVVLDSPSAGAAAAALEKCGVACAAHILIADGICGAVGMEWSVEGWRKVLSMEAGDVGIGVEVLAHTNHFLEGVPNGVCHGGKILEDSTLRMARIMELLRAKIMPEGAILSVVDVEKLLDDDKGYPCSINRAAICGKGLQTLFSIVMDLKRREGWIRVGRPTDGGERVFLGFEGV